VRSHLFDIGLLELHDAAMAWSSFVVISVGVVAEWWHDTSGQPRQWYSLRWCVCVCMHILRIARVDVCAIMLLCSMKVDEGVLYSCFRQISR
jgi:hypothetical protein